MPDGDNNNHPADVPPPAPRLSPPIRDWTQRLNTICRDTTRRRQEKSNIILKILLEMHHWFVTNGCAHYKDEDTGWEWPFVFDTQNKNGEYLEDPFLYLTKEDVQRLAMTLCRLPDDTLQQCRATYFLIYIFDARPHLVDTLRDIDILTSLAITVKKACILLCWPGESDVRQINSEYFCVAISEKMKDSFDKQPSWLAYLFPNSFHKWRDPNYDAPPLTSQELINFLKCDRHGEYLIHLIQFGRFNQRNWGNILKAKSCDYGSALTILLDQLRQQYIGEKNEVVQNRFLAALARLVTQSKVLKKDGGNNPTIFYNLLITLSQAIDETAVGQPHANPTVHAKLIILFNQFSNNKQSIWAELFSHRDQLMRRLVERNSPTLNGLLFNKHMMGIPRHEGIAYRSSLSRYKLTLEAYCNEAYNQKLLKTPLANLPLLFDYDHKPKRIAWLKALEERFLKNPPDSRFQWYDVVHPVFHLFKADHWLLFTCYSEAAQQTGQSIGWHLLRMLFKRPSRPNALDGIDVVLSARIGDADFANSLVGSLAKEMNKEKAAYLLKSPSNESEKGCSVIYLLYKYRYSQEPAFGDPEKMDNTKFIKVMDQFLAKLISELSPKNESDNSVQDYLRLITTKANSEPKLSPLDMVFCCAPTNVNESSLVETLKALCALFKNPFWKQLRDYQDVANVLLQTMFEYSEKPSIRRAFILCFSQCVESLTDNDMAAEFVFEWRHTLQSFGDLMAVVAAGSEEKKEAIFRKLAIDEPTKKRLHLQTTDYGQKQKQLAQLNDQPIAELVRHILSGSSPLSAFAEDALLKDIDPVRLHIFLDDAVIRRAVLTQPQLWSLFLRLFRIFPESFKEEIKNNPSILHSLPFLNKLLTQADAFVQHPHLFDIFFEIIAKDPELLFFKAYDQWEMKRFPLLFRCLLNDGIASEFIKNPALLQKVFNTLNTRIDKDNDWTINALSVKDFPGPHSILSLLLEKKGIYNNLAYVPVLNRILNKLNELLTRKATTFSRNQWANYFLIVNTAIKHYHQWHADLRSAFDPLLTTFMNCIKQMAQAGSSIQEMLVVQLCYASEGRTLLETMSAADLAHALQEANKMIAAYPLQEFISMLGKFPLDHPSGADLTYLEFIFAYRSGLKSLNDLMCIVDKLSLDKWLTVFEKLASDPETSLRLNLKGLIDLKDPLIILKYRILHSPFITLTTSCKTFFTRISEARLMEFFSDLSIQQAMLTNPLIAQQFFFLVATSPHATPYTYMLQLMRRHLYVVNERGHALPQFIQDSYLGDDIKSERIQALQALIEQSCTDFSAQRVVLDLVRRSSKMPERLPDTELDTLRLPPHSPLEETADQYHLKRLCAYLKKCLPNIMHASKRLHEVLDALEAQSKKSPQLKNILRYLDYVCEALHVALKEEGNEASDVLVRANKLLVENGELKGLLMDLDVCSRGIREVCFRILQVLLGTTEVEMMLESAYLAVLKRWIARLAIIPNMEVHVDNGNIRYQLSLRNTLPESDVHAYAVLGVVSEGMAQEVLAEAWKLFKEREKFVLDLLPSPSTEEEPGRPLDQHCVEFLILIQREFAFLAPYLEGREENLSWELEDVLGWIAQFKEEDAAANIAEKLSLDGTAPDITIVFKDPAILKANIETAIWAYFQAKGFVKQDLSYEEHCAQKRCIWAFLTNADPSPSPQLQAGWKKFLTCQDAPLLIMDVLQEHQHDLEGNSDNLNNFLDRLFDSESNLFMRLFTDTASVEALTGLDFVREDESTGVTFEQVRDPLPFLGAITMHPNFDNQMESLLVQPNSLYFGLWYFFAYDYDRLEPLITMMWTYLFPDNGLVRYTQHTHIYQVLDAIRRSSKDEGKRALVDSFIDARIQSCLTTRQYDTFLQIACWTTPINFQTLAGLKKGNFAKCLYHRDSQESVVVVHEANVQALYYLYERDRLHSSYADKFEDFLATTLEIADSSLVSQIAEYVSARSLVSEAADPSGSARVFCLPRSTSDSCLFSRSFDSGRGERHGAQAFGDGRRRAPSPPL